MSISNLEANGLWDSFLERWPLEKLAGMTLQEYSKAGDADCLTYGWLEQKTEQLGSIWGGSAFKFGVYSRKDQSDKPGGAGRMYSTEYGWYTKYGSTAEEAFERVRALVIEVARAARGGDLDAIQRVDLGTTIKWKLAFLYQDRSAPTVLPVFSGDHLAAYLEWNSKRNIAELQKAAMAQRGDADLFQFGADVWDRAEATLAAMSLRIEDVQAYMQESPERFQPIKNPTDKIAGFVTSEGRQVALALDNKAARLWLEPGPWLDTVKGQLKDIELYATERSRNTNLGANAPRLAQGWPAVYLTVPTRAALVALFDSYETFKPAPDTAMNSRPSAVEDLPIALNQILYGPPGTGKTYETAATAVRLCLGEEEAALLLAEGRRDDLMKTYHELAEAGRIEFITFHQSYSYEDFVEGLRPTTDVAENSADEDVESGSDVAPVAGGFRLSTRDGVFKRVCERARLDLGGARDGRQLNRKRAIFKIALGRRGIEQDRITAGLTGNLIHLGWGDYIDWSDERFRNFEEIRREWKEKKDPNATGKDPNIEMTYSFRSDMKTGDYVVLSDGRDMVRAFGQVSGEYYFDPEASYHPHRRRVEWIWQSEEGIDRNTFYPKNFRRHSVYELNKTLIDWDALEAIVLGQSAPQPAQAARPYVLVIDEINRANISKVFGELITLLEPDKRLGQVNELRVRLPYSEGPPFGVPPNLYIIGTMNTADRSIALLDTALRRRFAFRELMPAPLLLKTIDGINLAVLLATINERIEYLFDREHQIGHAYFINCKTREDVEEVMRHKVIPLLAEYFYEDWGKVAAVLGDADDGADDLEGGFLKRMKLRPPKGLGGEDDGEVRFRWSVRDRFDFSGLVRG